jgi:hypothetical protein
VVRRQWGTLLAVGSLVAAEAALGVMLVVNGAEDTTPNPWRTGDGYPQPPPCSVVDQELLAAVIGPGQPADERNSVGGLVRQCTFGQSPGQRVLELSMRSHPIVQPGQHGSHVGLSPLEVSDNLTRREVKRYFDSVIVRFRVDNLEVLVYLQDAANDEPRMDGDLPTPENARSRRDRAVALARDLADKLAVRNPTGPTQQTAPPR